VFGEVFKGLVSPAEDVAPIPEEWLQLVAEKYLTPEEMEKVKALGSWDEIMETLKKRLEEQQGRHEGGSKWIGTGGTSPFGHGGYNPEGVRIGRPGQAWPRDQGVGKARVSRSRRPARDRDAGDQGRAAPAPPLRPGGCGGRA
jgi:uncharacterized protein with von Willebrand factor type A (vWA) domain